MPVMFEANLVYGMPLIDATALPEEWQDDPDGCLENNLVRGLTTAWSGNAFEGKNSTRFVVFDTGDRKMDCNEGEHRFYSVEEITRIANNGRRIQSLMELSANHPGAFGKHGWYLVTSVG